MVKLKGAAKFHPATASDYTSEADAPPNSPYFVGDIDMVQVIDGYVGRCPVDAHFGRDALVGQVFIAKMVCCRTF